MTAHRVWHVLSLGAGVQSSTLALMAEAGEFEVKPDFSIFSDTMDEPKTVYAWLEWLDQQLSYKTHRVTAGSLSEAALKISINRITGKPYYSNRIPAYIKGLTAEKEGKVGRYCTRDHKIKPIIRECRRMVGAKALRVWRAKHKDRIEVWNAYNVARAAAEAARKANKAVPPVPAFPDREWKEMQADALVVQWIGISLDEISRMKPSRDPWIRHRWPLIEREMTRHDCKNWMKARGYPEPPRSACRYCPYKSNAEWARLKTSEPEEFEQAAVFEEKLQAVHTSIVPLSGKIKGVPFLHRTLKPLREVDLSTDLERGQMSMFNSECEGMCGV